MGHENVQIEGAGFGLLKLANQSAQEALTDWEQAIPLGTLNESLDCQAMCTYAVLNDQARIAQKYQLPAHRKVYRILAEKTGK